MEKIKIGNADLYCGDCLEIMQEIQPVDVVFTSPPYAKQRNYEGNYFDWSDAEKFMNSLPCKKDTQVFINVGLVHRGGPVEYWRGLMDGNIGWFGWYVWDQGDGLPGNWNGRLAPSFEFIFHFTNSPILPDKIKPTVSVRRVFSSGLRQKSGAVNDMSQKGELVNTSKIPDSVIRVYREMRRDYDHPARFPVKLAEELLLAYSLPVVLDPFMGSGTTGEACANLGRKFIGIEIERKYFDIACERIEAAQQQIRLAL